MYIDGNGCNGKNCEKNIFVFDIKSQFTDCLIYVLCDVTHLSLGLF